MTAGLEAASRGPVHLEPPRDLASLIDEAEYARLLGYPERRIAPGRSRAVAERARTWHRRHGSAWALARLLSIATIRDTGVDLEDGETLTSRALARRLRRANATALVVAMVSAGREADAESASLWQRDRPDESYYLDRFNAAVVEHLASWTGKALRTELARNGRAPLASYSPGYAGWDLEEMTAAGRCLTGDRASDEWGFDILDSGMIRPVSSLLTVFGVTADLEAAAESWRKSGCSWCSSRACAFRRW